MKQGWKIKKLGDVCDLQNGYAFKSKWYVDNSNTLNIRMSNIRPDGTFNPEHNIKFLPDKYAKEYAKFLLDEGDLVIAMTDMAGDPKILGVPTLVKYQNGRNFLLNQRVGRLHQFDSDVFVPYLRHYLSSPILKVYYKSLGAGGLQINISKKQILSAQFPIPPLEEQKRIVAKLDECFEAIDKARANVEKNLNNAKELFQSQLNEIFSQKGDGWEEKKLGEVAKTTAGGTPLKSNKEYYENGLIPWLRSGEVGVRKITESKMFITELGLENSSAKLVPKNSVMIAMYGATAGEVGVLKFESSTNQAVCAILPNDKLKPEFLYYFFLNEKEKLVSQAVGNAQPNISQQKIKNTIIPYLSIELQEKIVGQLDTLIFQTQALESNYQQELDALDELKKSILQKAFNGEL